MKNHPVTNPNGRFTYGDLCTWPEDERWELIDGEAVAMVPPPNQRHQEVVGELYRQMANFFLGKTCKVLVRPFGVLFPKAGEPDERVATMVEPDVMVICDPGKLNGKVCRGAPDLVVEVLSPSTSSQDCIRKRRVYEAAGVREYWLVDPANRVIIVLRNLDGKGFGPAIFLSPEGLAETPLFPGLQIDLGLVFPAEPSVVREDPPPAPPRRRRPAKKKG
ncbi:MAG: Uma2 family endonuclease [Candidatus Riflebacteria bacterium]|nr:Uma2 family endonuclease [Candidatus Riflebacteria bacterium]